MLQTETVLLTAEAKDAIASLGFANAQAVLYDLLGLDEPVLQSSPPFVYEQSLPVLIWQSGSGSWYAMAAGHPYLCSASSSYDATLRLVQDKITDLFASRQLSATELAVVRTVTRGLTALAKTPGKNGVVALGKAIENMTLQYWGKDSAVADASYLLACEVTVQSELASQLSKDWAESNMLKYVFATEAIEAKIRDVLS